MERLSRLFGTSGRGLLMHCLLASAVGLTQSSIAQDGPVEATTDEPREAIETAPVEAATDETDTALLDEERSRTAQTALDSELASAKRFEAELNALLLTNGQLNNTDDDALSLIHI